MTINETTVPTIEIPEGLVSIDYLMDPKTDQVIRGKKLQEGQVVLLEKTYLRDNPERLSNSTDCYLRTRIFETARWCRVTELEPVDHYGVVHFVGLYSDGTTMSRGFNVSHYWLRKIA